MANEVRICYPTGQTLYFIIRRADGHIWDTAGAAFEDWNVMTDYDTAMTDETGSFYQASLSGASFAGANAVAGKYTIQIFLQTGGGPVDADPLLGSTEIYWNGTAEVTETEYYNQVNTVAEMIASAPPASPTREEMANFMYRLFRNETRTTSSLLTVRSNGDAGDLFKATIGKNGTTFTKDQYVSG